MTMAAAQLAFVRGAFASSVLGRARALILSGLLVCAVPAQAVNVQTSDQANANDNSASSSSNAANNPAEPRFTLQYWNCYAPSLNELSGGAENGSHRCSGDVSANAVGTDGQPHVCRPSRAPPRQGIPARWWVYTQRLHRGTTFALSHRPGCTKLPGLHRHLTTTTAELLEWLAYFLSWLAIAVISTD